MRDNLANLLQTRMTRKQFITTLLLALASIGGIGRIIKFVFGEKHSLSHQFGTLNKTPGTYGHTKR